MQLLPKAHSCCFFCQLRLSAGRPSPRLSNKCQLPRSFPKRSYNRPSIAPKPVPDIKHIAQNPGLYEQNCIDRNYKKQARNGWHILELRQRRAELHKQAREAREANNKLQDRFQRAGRKNDQDISSGGAGETAQELFEKARALKEELVRFLDEEREIEEKMMSLALSLPNLSGPHTPTGSEPKLLRTYYAPRQDSGSQSLGKSHTDIGASLYILDFPAAATSSGWGWYFLKNEAALLEQALIQYALHVLVQKGYQIVSPPSIVYSHIAAACGFQPRDQNDEQQIYNLTQSEKDRERKPALSLAATAEIPLAAMKSGVTLTEEETPLKVAAVSRCFRAEAGARGVDTKGLYRVHEFTKVEMFAWTQPDSEDEESGYFGSAGTSQSDTVFNEMMSIQEEILQSLGLSYRVLEMPSVELGATASRKQDIEVYFPSRKDKDQGWGEVTSTSICTDYQTRRLATRLRRKDGSLDWPYTLNGTALAVPRILAALLEVGYRESGNGVGSVVIPECLRTWMGGMERIQR